MADPSLLMNSEPPVNGISFPMPSANMAFTNGQDMQQGKVLPNANPFSYPMFGVGAPGDMPAPHLSTGAAQIMQGGDSNSSWMTGGIGQSMMMPQHAQSMPQQAQSSFMMNRPPPFQSPASSMHMPPNMQNAMLPPAPQMNPGAGQMGMNPFQGFPSWPNGPPQDPNWPQQPLAGTSLPSLKPPAMGMPSGGPVDPASAVAMSASPIPVGGDISSQSLPELGDVELPEDKSRNAEPRNMVNGDVPSTPGTAAAAAPGNQHQGGLSSSMSNYSTMMSTSMSQAAAAASPIVSADMSGQKMFSNRSLLGHDGMVNSSAGAMMPAYSSGAQPPSTVALTTQHATVPMHPVVARHTMAAPHSSPMQPGMVYPGQMYPRMPMDSMLPPHPSTAAGGSAGQGVHTAASSQPPKASLPARSETPRETGTPVGKSRCPKNISEVLQPLYELGEEPGRKTMLDQLVELSQETGTPTLYVPTLSSDHTHVDLYRLYEVIKEMGGLCVVVRKKVWRRVIEGMGMPSPSNVSALASTLRTHYQKLLLPLECKEKGKDLTEEMEKVDALRRTRASARSMASRNAASSPTSRRASSPDPGASDVRTPVTGANVVSDPAPRTSSSTASAEKPSKSQLKTEKPATVSSQSAPASVSSTGGIAAGFAPSQPASAPVAPSPWPNQMQPPSFPPPSFPNVDPSHPTAMVMNHADPMMQIPPNAFPDPSTQPDGFANMNQHRPGMPDSSFPDPRMVQYKNAQMQQWKHQQHQQQQQQQQQQYLLQRQQQQQQMMAAGAGRMPPSYPTMSSSFSATTPQSPLVSGSLSNDVFVSNAAATPTSPAVVASRSQVPLCATPTGPQPNAPFSRLLSGVGIEGALARVSSAQMAARGATSSSQQDSSSGSSTDLATVEHAVPKSVKRKHLCANHLAQRLGNLPNLWRLHMCLKGGLVAESAQAMDILSIIVGDEQTLCLFQLPQQPAVLETILSHLASCLHHVFGGFDDICTICDGDAKRRFFPEDPSDKEIQRTRDEEYERPPAPAGEDDPCSMDWRRAVAEEISDETAHLVDELPDGLRHILYPIGSDDPAQSEPCSAEMDTEPAEEYAGCNAKHAAKGTSRLCPAWLQHGTGVESEPCSLTSRTSDQRLLGLRALCCSNLIRSLSFLASNERHMSRHFGLMAIIARVETMFQEASADDGTLSDIASAWWWPWLEIVRADLMVTLVNLSGQVDLSCLPTKLAAMLLRGLCHWCVSTSSSARDPLPTASACPGLSLQRLALEALSKISIGLGNVESMMSALDERTWQCLCGRLVLWLLEKRHSVQYELALVLLCSLVSSDAVSRYVCLQHHCVVTLMMQLLSETESYLCSVSRGAILADSHTIASQDLLRRAATLLLVLARQRCNRQHFAHHQSHLLILAASPYLYAIIPPILVDLLFQIGLE